ncbi:MAG: hypothetical protein AABY83_08810 [Pseudomonadota bacterium]
MKMRLIGIMASALIFSTAGAAQQAKDYKTNISSLGANAVYKQMWPKDRREVITAISSGKKEWLEVAIAIREVANAHDAEDLDAAFSAAITRSPGNALQFVGAPFRANIVCTPRMTEPEPHELDVYFHKTMQALESVTDKSLADSKTLCLYYLRHSKAQIDAIDELKLARLTPQGLLAELAKNGAQQTVKNLQDTKHWDAVLARIGAGNPQEWIVFAYALRTVTDSLEAIKIELANALHTSPNQVLSSIKDDETLRMICSLTNANLERVVVDDLKAQIKGSILPLTKMGSASERAKICLDALN